jgi:hypothetical protein
VRVDSKALNEQRAQRRATARLILYSVYTIDRKFPLVPGYLSTAQCVHTLEYQDVYQVHVLVQ